MDDRPAQLPNFVGELFTLSPAEVPLLTLLTGITRPAHCELCRITGSEVDRIFYLLAATTVYES